MFEQSIYESSNLSTLYNKQLNKYNIIQHDQLTRSERSIIINILQMLLGMPSDIFILKSSYNNLPSFQVCFNKISMAHLSCDTLKNQLIKFSQYGNKIQIIKLYAKNMYKMSNYLLRNFSQGIFQIINKFTIFITSLLHKVQQQSGNITRNQLQYQKSQQNPLTLLTLDKQLKNYEQIINFIITTVDKININDKSSSQDLQRSVTFLLNVYHYQCDKNYLNNLQDSLCDIHILFKGILINYIKLVQEWFQMQVNILLMKSNLGFFIQFQQAVQESQQKLFQIKKAIKKQLIPQLFNKNWNKILELGKTIQFIKLYFRAEQKQMFKSYLNLELQFSGLYKYINQLQRRKQEDKRFFNVKNRKFSLISDKIKNISRPQIKFNKIQSDNPYKMYPEVNGFINLRSNYIYKTKQNQKKLQNSSQINNSTIKTSQNSINHDINIIFDDILQKVSNKCLNLLQKDKLRQSLQHTLRGIKKIMLFAQGDFILEFFQLSKEILNKPADKISRNNIQRLIQQAIRSTNLSQQIDIIKQNITFTFIKTQQNLKGWRVFSFIYKPEKPTNCIFTSKVIQSYSMISNLLFNLRRCQEFVIYTWQKYLIQGMGSILKVRNVIHHYIKALLSYILLEIQNIWTQFLDSFNQNGNILTIIQANQIVLSKIKAISLENPPLLNCVLFIVKIVDRFEHIHNNIQEGNEQYLKRDLDQIWTWFLNILDQSKLITNFCDTFDFRSNYTS